MEFHRRLRRAVSSLALFPGAFNPPTRAHLAMAQAALAVVEEVVFTLPRTFPHKTYLGPDFETRLELLHMATASEPRFSVASTHNGLLIEIARAARRVGELQPSLYFLCGSDAAKRFEEWNYGDESAFARQLEEYQLLVAPRDDQYLVAPRYADRVQILNLPEEYRSVSSTAFRESRQADGLVPDEIREAVSRLYSG